MSETVQSEHSYFNSGSTLTDDYPSNDITIESHGSSFKGKCSRSNKTLRVLHQQISKAESKKVFARGVMRGKGRSGKGWELVFVI